MLPLACGLGVAVRFATTGPAPADRSAAAIAATAGAGSRFTGESFSILATFSPKPERHAHLAHVILKRLGDFAVEKPKHLAATLDKRDLHAQRRQHAGVFGAHHAAADDDHGLGQMVELEQAVGGENGFIVKRDTIRTGRAGAGGDDDDLGRDQFEGVAVIDVEKLSS